jgi:hypothetical protein
MMQTLRYVYNLEKHIYTQNEMSMAKIKWLELHLLVVGNLHTCDRRSVFSGELQVRYVDMPNEPAKKKKLTRK